MLSYHILGKDLRDSSPPLRPSCCRGQVAVGPSGLFCPRLLSVPGNERIGSLPLSLHCGEIHCHLSSHEGPGSRRPPLTTNIVLTSRLFQYICTLSRAKRIILCCWTFAVCYSSPWLVLAHIKTSCISGFGEVNLALAYTDRPVSPASYKSGTQVHLPSGERFYDALRDVLHRHHPVLPHPPGPLRGALHPHLHHASLQRPEDIQ